MYGVVQDTRAYTATKFHRDIIVSKRELIKEVDIYDHKFKINSFTWNLFLSSRVRAVTLFENKF